MFAIAGQHGAVAGEDAAARAGQADRPSQRPRGRLAEGGPLAHLKLHRPAEDDCQQCCQPDQRKPQSAPRIDHAADRHCIAVELAPIEGHRTLPEWE